MKLFVDASVALAAVGQRTGASRAIFDAASKAGWELMVSRFVVHEVEANLHRLPGAAGMEWSHLAQRVSVVRDLTSFDQAVVFQPAKDRPVLFTAAGWADVLLTLDRAHFQRFFRTGFYSLRVSLPGDFLKAERAAGRFSLE